MSADALKSKRAKERALEIANEVFRQRGPRVLNLSTYDGVVPTGVVRIDRKTKWGNPFRIGADGDRETVIRKYREWMERVGRLQLNPKELQGKDLACWCAPESCHGDVLLELANREAE